jgi:hypothetical protein
MDDMAQNEQCQVPCGEIRDLRASLATLINAVDVSTATTELRVRRVEEGVSNYVKFMAEAREFFVRRDTQELELKKFHELRDSEIKADLSARDKRIMYAIAALTLLVAFIGIVLALPPAITALKDLLRSDVNWNHIFTTLQTYTAHMSRPQDATVTAIIEGRP